MNSCFYNPIVYHSNNIQLLFEMLNSQLSTCLGVGKSTVLRTGEEIYACDKTHQCEFDQRIIHFLINEILVKDYGIRITSGYRCHNYNIVNYLSNTYDVKLVSLHCFGQAADVIIYKNDKALNFVQNETIIKSWQNEPKYNFSLEDIDAISQENKYLNLTKSIKTLFYFKTYRHDEGRDMDNFHKEPYIHIDSRGIRMTPKTLKYYKKANLID